MALYKNRWKTLEELVNKYPVGKYDSVQPHYLKGSMGSSRGSGGGSGPDFVNHITAGLVNTLNGTNTARRFNQLGSAFPYPFPKFGNIKRPTGLLVQSTNLGGNPTQFRFIIQFTDSGRRYISSFLKTDMDSRWAEGNPYYTKHLIPTINLRKQTLNQFKESFSAIERQWGVNIVDSLGTESGETGEREIVRYIDTLLYDEPVGANNTFVLPYKKGTVVSSHLFSQNPIGAGNSDSTSQVQISRGSSLGKGNAGEVNVVTANTGEEVTIVGDTFNLDLQDVADTAADIGSGNYDGPTTTGVIDSDGDGQADSIANFADELEDSDGDGIFDLGAAGILGGNLGGSGASTSSGGSTGTSTGGGTTTTTTRNPFNVSTAPLGYAGSPNERRNYAGEVWVWSNERGWEIEIYAGGNFDVIGGGSSTPSGGGSTTTSQGNGGGGSPQGTGTNSIPLGGNGGSGGNLDQGDNNYDSFFGQGVSITL